jgi:hypothetical protein
MKRTLFLLFFVHLLTRLIFLNINGVFNNYNLQADSYWLVALAEGVTHGNFNFDIGRFIASPLFPVICALFKIVFTFEWPFYLVFFQLILSAVSGLYIYKIALLMFENQKAALFSSILFALFPMTIWYINTFSQESIFQALLIITVYHLLLALKTRKFIYTITAAVFFSFTYLTKSHILLFSIFIPVIYLLYFRSFKSIHHILLFGSIAFLFSLPFGIYNYIKHGTYVISSNGIGYQFYLGNTEAGFVSIVDVPDKSTDKFEMMKDITVTAGMINGNPKYYATLLHQSQRVKQSSFFSEAVKWIKNHPLKFIKLKIFDAIFFLMPGVSFRHYTFLQWLSAFTICLPVYFFGYYSIYLKCRENFSKHSWIFFLFISMLMFSIILYVQNRFRTITLEPFYVIYAAEYFYRAVSRCQKAKSTINFLNELFFRFPQSITVKNLIRFKLN